jgi:hypothetical protein
MRRCGSSLSSCVLMRYVRHLVKPLLFHYVLGSQKEHLNMQHWGRHAIVKSVAYGPHEDAVELVSRDIKSWLITLTLVHTRI